MHSILCSPFEAGVDSSQVGDTQQHFRKDFHNKETRP
jgi:hypothetical protein